MRTLGGNGLNTATSEKGTDDIPLIISVPFVLVNPCTPLLGSYTNALLTNQHI